MSTPCNKKTPIYVGLREKVKYQINKYPVDKRNSVQNLDPLPFFQSRKSWYVLFSFFFQLSIDLNKRNKTGKEYEPVCWLKDEINYNPGRIMYGHMS
jgi:hypothetical protein